MLTQGYETSLGKRESPTLEKRHHVLVYFKHFSVPYYPLKLSVYCLNCRGDHTSKKQSLLLNSCSH